MTEPNTKCFPALNIGDLTLETPVVQGGMGVKISRSNLTAAVSECGGMGVIASVGLGDELGLLNEYLRTETDALRWEIQETRKKTDKPFGVNIMVALTNYEKLCRVCDEEQVGAIFSGAGLPLKLPAYVKGSKTKLIPIVSGAKAADLILRYWIKKYDRVPDALVVEGPLAGGHLGFSEAEVAKPRPLGEILGEVLEALDKHDTPQPIPVIAAGGIFSGGDILQALEAGASGVQMGTRFIATDECDAPLELKQACLDAEADDVVVMMSPVGLPARILKNEFVAKIIRGEKIKFKCPYKCLKTCKQKEARYCIAQALVNASIAKFDGGFTMPGANVHKLTEIISVSELFRRLHTEAFGD